MPGRCGAWLLHRFAHRGTGELFFAVRGERLDGHDFVAGAIERGAVAAVVSRSAWPRCPTLRCGSAADHGRSAARFAGPGRACPAPVGARVIAVTGSAGKTTTKEAISAALGARFMVLKSQGNLNNTFGLPLQLLRLEPSTS